MTTTLDEYERKLLLALVTEPRVVVSPTPLILEALRERGYVRLSKARSGPLCVYTGEIMASLTVAGREVLGAEGKTIADDTGGVKDSP